MCTAWKGFGCSARPGAPSAYPDRRIQAAGGVQKARKRVELSRNAPGKTRLECLGGVFSGGFNN